MSAIGVQLGHLRVAQGLTQQQLAERTGLRRDTISALERGKSQAIEFTTLASLCDALGVGPGDLLTLGPTAHVAPILGGEDEDAILIDRMTQDEQDIAALIADPSLALQYLTLEEDAADDMENTSSLPGILRMPSANLMRSR
ncbi:MAG: helix-turn-helix transcriptional regulator [Thermomicrobiales bacterium]